MNLKEDNLLKEYHNTTATSNDVSYKKICSWITSWLSDKLNIDIKCINEEIPILSYGLDSLSAVELERDIIAEFNLDFFVGDIFENASIRNFIEFSLDREYVT
jgi:acyl carrier protein